MTWGCSQVQVLTSLHQLRASVFTGRALRTMGQRSPELVVQDRDFKILISQNSQQKGGSILLSYAISPRRKWYTHETQETLKPQKKSLHSLWSETQRFAKPKKLKEKKIHLSTVSSATKSFRRKIWDKLMCKDEAETIDEM